MKLSDIPAVNMGTGHVSMGGKKYSPEEIAKMDYPQSSLEAVSDAARISNRTGYGLSHPVDRVA